jgi:hypothetical protein
MVKHGYDVVITGHNPGMQERIPVHRVVGSKPMKERIGIGENLRVEQVVEAQGAICLGRN